MSGEQKLTEEDREKIQRLLESGTLENVTHALSLIEETVGQEDIADIFTMNVIVELICLNSPESLEVMIMAGQFIRRCPETWKRFSEAVVGPDVLTSQKYQVISESSDQIIGIAWPIWEECPDSQMDGEMLMADYSQFTLISDTAAARIAPAEDYGLFLDGLTELSDAAAESLGNNDWIMDAGGGCLSLNGLTVLSDAAAESLSKHRGQLRLGNLTSLSDAAAESLGKKEPKLESSSLNLDNLPASAAKILLDARHGMTPKLTNAVAEKVIFDGDDSIDIDEFTTMEDGAAEILSKNEGYLPLNGLTDLSDPAAEHLSKHEGVLLLNGLAVISDAAAKSLSRHQGDLSLHGLTGLSDAAAESLSKHEGELGLDGLTELSDAVITMFSMHKEELNFHGRLRGLTELSDAAAESLSKHKGELGLDGLTELSDVAAANLSKHKGDLDLSGLKELSDAAAESFSKHKSDLKLTGLTALTDTAAESLAKKQPKFESWLITLDNLPGSTVKILRDAGHGVFRLR
jgi:hypothetical protein